MAHNNYTTKINVFARGGEGAPFSIFIRVLRLWEGREGKRISDIGVFTAFLWWEVYALSVFVSFRGEIRGRSTIFFVKGWEGEGGGFWIFTSFLCRSVILFRSAWNSGEGGKGGEKKEGHQRFFGFCLCECGPRPTEAVRRLRRIVFVSTRFMLCDTTHLHGSMGSLISTG